MTIFDFTKEEYKTIIKQTEDQIKKTARELLREEPEQIRKMLLSIAALKIAAISPDDSVLDNTVAKLDSALLGALATFGAVQLIAEFRRIQIEEKMRTNN